MLGISKKYIYMLFAGWEVLIVKNCDQGLENAARGHTVRTNPKPVNNLFIFSKLSNEKKVTEKTLTSVTVTVVIDRKIRTALRTNQIVGFITVPTWKNKYIYYKMVFLTEFLLLLFQGGG